MPNHRGQIVSVGDCSTRSGRASGCAVLTPEQIVSVGDYKRGAQNRLPEAVLTPEQIVSVSDNAGFVSRERVCRPHARTNRQRRRLGSPVCVSFSHLSSRPNKSSASATWRGECPSGPPVVLTPEQIVSVGDFGASAPSQPYVVLTPEQIVSVGDFNPMLQIAAYQGPHARTNRQRRRRPAGKRAAQAGRVLTPEQIVSVGDCKLVLFNNAVR